MSILKIYKTKNVKTPERSGKNAGFDFFVPDNFKGVILQQGERATIKSGIKVRIPKNHALIAFNKSGIAAKKGLQVGACVIDENYAGEISLDIYNTGHISEIAINPGMKLVQFILIPVEYADVKEFYDEEMMYKNFDKNERGEKGFGSTG